MKQWTAKFTAHRYEAHSYKLLIEMRMLSKDIEIYLLAVETAVASSATNRLEIDMEDIIA